MAVLLSFLDEALPAFGAGNGNLAFAPGNTHHLMAFGTIVIAMLPIFQTVEKLQEFAVFLIALIGIPGETTVQCPEHQTVGNSGQQQIQLHGIHKGTDQARHKTGRKNDHIQFVRSVAAYHKIPEGIAQTLKKLSNHKNNHLVICFFSIILQSCGNSTVKTQCLRIV